MSVKQTRNPVFAEINARGRIRKWLLIPDTRTAEP